MSRLRGNLTELNTEKYKGENTLDYFEWLIMIIFAKEWIVTYFWDNSYALEQQASVFICY